MGEVVKGLASLQHRIAALQSPAARKGFMQTVAVDLRGAMVKAERDVGARQTGTTAGSLQVQNVTATGAQIVGSQVNVWIETGTGIYGPRKHVITPKAKRALAFHSKGKGASLGASYRQTGRMTVGSTRKMGAGADTVVVRSVKGMKGRPYMQTALRAVGERAGIDLVAATVKTWNGAG